LAATLLEAAMTKKPNDFLMDGGYFYNTIPSMFGIFTYIWLIVVVNVAYMDGMGTPSATTPSDFFGGLSPPFARDEELPPNLIESNQHMQHNFCSRNPIGSMGRFVYLPTNFP